MRRNKVLNTLAAASMAAMMAVTAVPATTVLAAPAQKQSLSTDYDVVIGEDDDVHLYYKNGVEVDPTVHQISYNGSTVTVDGIGYDASKVTKVKLPKITGVKMFNGQSASIE